MDRRAETECTLTKSNQLESQKFEMNPSSTVTVASSTAEQTSTVAAVTAAPIGIPADSSAALQAIDDAQAGACNVFVPIPRVWAPKEVKDLWDGVFVLGGGDGELEQKICEALAKAPGSDPKLAEEVAWTEVPFDFLLDKREYKEDEWVDRYSCVGVDKFILHKHNPKNKCRNSIIVHASKYCEFKNRMRRLRQNLINFFIIEVNRCWRIQFKLLVPEMECNSFDDFLVKISSLPYGNNVRRWIFISSNHMWTREKFVWMEDQVKAVGKLTYGRLLVDGTFAKHSRRSGSIAKIGTRVKQSYLVDRLREVGKRLHKEVLYERLLKAKKPQAGVLKIIKVTALSHGFNGFIGLFAGHPALIHDALASSAIVPTGSDLPLDLKKLDLESYIRNRISKNDDGKTVTMEAVMKEWSALKSSEEVVVTVGTEVSDISPLTEVRVGVCIRCSPFLKFSLLDFCHKDAAGRDDNAGKSSPSVTGGDEDARKKDTPTVSEPTGIRAAKCC